MKKVLTMFVIAMLAISVLALGCTSGGETTVTQTTTQTTTVTATPTPAEKEKVVVTEVNWGSAAYQGYIMAFIIEHGYGYPVEVVAGSTIAMFQGVMMGDVDIFPEMWLPNQQEAWDSGLADNSFIPVTRTNNDNWQSCFVVPTYVIEGDSARGIEPMAPDLKSVDDLKDPKYIELFKDPEEPSKGRIVTCVPGWECEKVNAKQAQAYGLLDSYNLLPPGSSAALFASLQAAYEKGEPWLGYMWGPTWISGTLDLTLLEEPSYTAAAFENGECGYPSADLWIGASKSLAEKAPELFPFLVQWSFPTADMAEGVAYMQANEVEADAAAIWFLENREDMWTKWVPADVAANVKAALP